MIILLTAHGKKSLQNTNCFFAQILILGFETRSEVGPLFTARHTSGCAGVGKVCKRHVVGALTTASVGEKRTFPSQARSWPIQFPRIGHFNYSSSEIRKK